MKIVIFVKHVVDVALNIKVKDDGSLQEDGLQYVISAHDECAVEEALQIKEKKGGEITVVSMGPDSYTETIRKALALGADKAIHLSDPALYEGSDATANAKAFAAVLKDMEYDLVMLGKQAQDTDMQATAEILGEILGLPMASNGKKLEVEDGKILFHRQGDGKIEVVELTLPAVITVNNDINNPRNASLKGIMAAKRKPIDKKDAGALGVDAGSIGKAGALVERLRFETPPAREAGKKFEGDPVEVTTQVVDLLENEAKVIGG